MGLVENDRYSYVIESDNPLMLPISNPCHSIQIPKKIGSKIREDDDVTCETILADVEEGLFSQVRPF